MIGVADNPARVAPNDQPESLLDPATYPVKTTERPRDFAALLTHTEVMYPDWEHDIEKRHLFYVQGIVSFMRIFRNNRITFLKDDNFADKAQEIILNETDWPQQIALRWDESLSANQLRRIRSKEAVYIQKTAQTLVACEIAIRQLRPEISPFWVYDYMRVIPAVYNIDRFNPDRLKSISDVYPNLQKNILHASSQEDVQVLHDLSNGNCVTGSTARTIKDYIDKHCTADPDHAVGDIRFKPGRRFLGQKDASRHEYVEIV